MPAPIRMPGISWCKRRNMPPLTRVLLDWSRASRLSAPLRHALTARGLYCATGDEPSPDVLRRLPESNRKSIANPSSVSRARSEERSSLCLGVSKASRFTRGKPSVRIAFILEEPNRGRFVHREGKAGRFTYEKESGRASMYRLGRT